MSIIFEDRTKYINESIMAEYGRQKYGTRGSKLSEEEPNFIEFVKHNNFVKEMTLNITGMNESFLKRGIKDNIQSCQDKNTVEWSCGNGVNYSYSGTSFCNKFNNFDEIKAFANFGYYKKYYEHLPK
eukprot:UN04518